MLKKVVAVEKASLSSPRDEWIEEQRKLAIRDCYWHFLKLNMLVKKINDVMYIGYQNQGRHKACRDSFLNLLRNGELDTTLFTEKEKRGKGRHFSRKLQQVFFTRF